MPRTARKRQDTKIKKTKHATDSDKSVFDEFIGYLGKGSTDNVMKELRGDAD
jgi:hypothetical protein